MKAEDLKRAAKKYSIDIVELDQIVQKLKTDDADFAAYYAIADRKYIAIIGGPNARHEWNIEYAKRMLNVPEQINDLPDLLKDLKI